MEIQQQNKISNVNQQAISSRWLYGILAVSAAVIIAMMGYAYISSLKMVTEYVPLTDAVMEAKLQVVTGHLWFEEMISEDDSIQLEDVRAYIDEAEWYLNVILVGGENEKHKYKPVSNAEVRLQIQAAQQELADFWDVAVQRANARESAGVGSRLDQQFDAAFIQFSEEMDSVENFLYTFIDNELNTYQIVQLVMVVMVLVVLLFVGFMFYRFERSNTAQQESLLRNQDELRSSQDALRSSKEYLERTVSDYMVFVEAVADGDLTQWLKLDGTKRDGSKEDDDLYRLGNSFNKLVDSLRHLIGRVQQNAVQVAEASQQITLASEQSAQGAQQVAVTIQQVADGTAQQTESVTGAIMTIDGLGQAIDGVARGAQEQAEAVARSVELIGFIANTTQNVAVNAQSGAEGAALAAQTARDGAKTVEQTIKGMKSIKTRVDVSAEKVREMGQHSEQIGAIVETIDGIASQTNLLALNATIEAARAGEHGKGFAVVADEVRNLAEKAADATQEIAKLIKDVQQTVGEAIQAMDEGATEVEAGVLQATESGQALNAILTAIERVNKQMGDIAGAAQQMNASTNEMVNAMDSVSAIVEENTAMTEEMAASSGEVSQAFENIASVSEENSAATEEVSASSEEMAAQAEEVTASAQTLREMAQALQRAVALFKLPDGRQAGGFQTIAPAVANDRPGYENAVSGTNGG